jgi:hypothetical protein
MVDPSPVNFRQLAIEIAGRANKIDQYFPYWYSVGVFTPVCFFMKLTSEDIISGP